MRSLLYFCRWGWYNEKNVKRGTDMTYKASIMDEAQVRRSMARIAHEIIEKNNGAEHICLLGIRRRGIPLSKMLAENIEKYEGVSVPVGHVDIGLYRDDLTETGPQPTTSDSFIPCDLKDCTVVLVDDVIYTGRTVRAAIEAVVRAGRPRAIQLAVLIDRGHRELPIRADYVGKNVPTARDEMVHVMMEEFDGETGVSLYDL